MFRMASKKINKTRFQNSTYTTVVICDTFNDAFSSSDYTELSGKTISE